MAGCPKCSRDLIAANPHKPTVLHPNGYRSFREMSVGERLVLPERWFDGSLDALPPTYFAALPHPDGVTPSKSGTVGALGDAASDAVTALAQLDDRTFSVAADPASMLIDQSVSAADSNANPAIAAYAQATHIATSAARQRNQDLIRAIDSNDQSGATRARLDVQNDLLTAIDSAQLALSAIYGGGAPSPLPSSPAPLPASTLPATVLAAAQAAAAAIGADPNFCTSVAQPGTAANAAVHAFKMAWNAANPGNPVPINTSTYEQATADVLTQVLGTAAPAACTTRVPPLPPLPSPPPTPVVVPPKEEKGLSTAAVAGLGLLGAGAVGGAIYLATRPHKARVRRVRTSFRGLP